MTTIYTIGHSTHPINEFVDILKHYGIERLVDIRTVPRSRHNPQYEQDALKNSLETNAIDYFYLKGMGGLRPKKKDSINLGWRVDSFRNYADYMQTPQFAEAVEELIELGKPKTTVIMCAEAVPWRCHRSLVGDALLVRGVSVVDIFSQTKSSPHKLTSFAVVDETNIHYPKANSES